MPDQQGITSLDDLFYDLEGSRKAEGRIAVFLDGEMGVVRRQSPHRMDCRGIRGEARPGAGRSLLARCAEPTRRRHETLLYGTSGTVAVF